MDTNDCESTILYQYSGTCLSDKPKNTYMIKAKKCRGTKNPFRGPKNLLMGPIVLK